MTINATAAGIMRFSSVSVRKRYRGVQRAVLDKCDVGIRGLGNRGANREQTRVAAQEDLSPRYGGRGDEPFAKIVPGQDRRDAPRFHDDRLPGLARKIDLAVGGDRRREEHAVEPRLPDARPRL